MVSWWCHAVLCSSGNNPYAVQSSSACIPLVNCCAMTLPSPGPTRHSSHRRKMSRIGLVATFRFVPFLPREEGQKATDTFERCWSTLESFLLFHLSKGVQHIFLYADDDRGSNDVYIGESSLHVVDGSNVHCRRR